MKRNLASDFEARATSDPDAVALTFEDGRRWTYAALNAAGSDLAVRLRELAPTAGARVAVHVPNSPELVVGLLGAWKAGLVPVAISALYNEGELAKCVGQVDPAVIISAGPPTSAATGANWLPGQDLADIAATYEGGVSPSDYAAIWSPDVGELDEGVVLFTGGTTGEPKAVSLTHVGTWTSMSNLVRAQKGRPGPMATAPADVPPNLLALPLFHSGGLQSMLIALHLGRSILLIERFSVDRIGRLVPQYSIDNLFLLPTMIYDLVRASDPPNLTSVRRVLVAGQRLDPLLQQEFETKFNVMVLSNYGSTELGHVAGWTGPDLKAGMWRPGAVGRVYDGVELEIRAEDGSVLAQGETGEIWVKSRRTLGYVGTAGTESGDLLENGWIRSGDVGYLDEDRVLYLVGRRRELIKTGGFQVWPAELEQTIRQLEGIEDVSVIGMPDERLGEVPVAMVVVNGSKRSDGDTEREVIAFCRDRLAHYKAVRRVFVVDSLPRSEVGKIKRDELEALVRQHV